MCVLFITILYTIVSYIPIKHNINSVNHKKDRIIVLDEIAFSLENSKKINQEKIKHPIIKKI